MDRLVLSRQVVATWEAMGGPTNSKGNLRMIQNEIDILNTFAIEHPERLYEVEQLIRRYTALAERLISTIEQQTDPAAPPYPAPKSS